MAKNNDQWRKTMAKNNDDRSESSQGGGSPTKLLVLILCIILAFHLTQQMQSIGLYADMDQFSSSYYEVDDKNNDNGDDNDNDDDDKADAIIQRSYAKSYAHILPCDKDRPSRKSCIQKTVDYFNTPNAGGNYTHVPSIPWWFQTLLRDLPTSGAYGFWHHFSTTEPTFNFCTIGKVATTEWRRVFCKLNADDCKVPGSCGKRGCSWRTKKEMPENAPWAVFLRDPLERLLSGEKC